MRALAWRQLMVATRLPAVWAAAGFHIAVLTAYVFVWGNGIPVAGARSPFSQFVSAQTVVLLAVLPWVAARCAPVHERGLVSRVAVLAACTPAHVITGAALGLAAVVSVVALTGLPLAMLSQQIADGPAIDLAAAQLRVAALGACAATLTLAAVALSRSRIGGWLIATGSTALAAWLAPSGAVGALALAAAAAIITVGLAQRAQRLWHCRPERQA